ncbi:MAG: hypothetical protein EPN14_01155 [Gallionella sp.]|nr:MAG: hypothetical protein EPN14_01155 [Gallionella sp.]
MARVIAVFCLAATSLAASAAPLAEKLAPGTPYYFDSFNAGKQPWEHGQHLNLEEVFKNYQYYEIVLDQNGREMTVNQFIRGNKTGSEKYLILPDGSLRKKM